MQVTESLSLGIIIIIIIVVVVVVVVVHCCHVKTLNCFMYAILFYAFIFILFYIEITAHV